MSSKPRAAGSRTKLRPRDTGVRGCAPATAPYGVAKEKGRRQPQAEDFLVTFELPQTLPILDRELRAIEILFGKELQTLLADETALQSLENKR
ncbi:hypothetical protein [Bradyrhizobium sp.]|uniref:hypothetical protein n=1 Tax=Bradyrhizobium sp. TaxID=376 RepID=UPI001EBC3EA2|nr:hypothetical protein [Bradyrhizobium sp.]MBV9978444.1 hypothetical protein [Bradyrhizobium sp.]